MSREESVNNKLSGEIDRLELLHLAKVCQSKHVTTHGPIRNDVNLCVVAGAAMSQREKGG